jgi:hypothetical protein
MLANSTKSGLAMRDVHMSLESKITTISNSCLRQSIIHLQKFVFHVFDCYDAGYRLGPNNGSGNIYPPT